MTASNPTPVRQRRPRILVHSAFCLFALVAALGSPARALRAPYPPDITPPADLPGLPSTLVVDDSVPAAAPGSDFMMDSHSHQELRLRHRHRHMHLHRRQKDEDEGEGEDKDGGKGGSGDKSEDKDKEEGEDEGNGKGGGDKSEDKEEDGDKGNGKGEGDNDGDKTQTADEEKETDKVSTSPPSADDDKDGKDDEGDKGDDKDEESTSEAPTKTATDDPTSTSTSKSTSTATKDADDEDADDEDAPLPLPFDGTASSEFKSSRDAEESCPDFISSLLSSDGFNDCYPISMLILKSKGFFDAKRRITSMVRVLDAGCAADVDSCSDFMRTAARNLTAEENCKEEYNDGVTAVTEAYNGLMNYKIVYSATCLQDPDTDQYCYASAATNTSDSSDSYLYFLPYDLTLPGSSTPSCNWCNKETMDIFHAASSNRDQLISNTYEDAARQINNLCDPDWVNGTLPEAAEGMGLALLPSWSLVAASVALAGALGSLL